MQVQCFVLQSTSYANEWPALCLFLDKRGAFFAFDKTLFAVLNYIGDRSQVETVVQRDTRGAD